MKHHLKDYSFLKKTDDPFEQIAIGSRIVKENPQIYTGSLYEMIGNTLQNNIESSNYSNEQLVYKSIYDYWVWGFSVDEVVFYHLIDADSSVKKEYITNQTRFDYYHHLNRKEDAYMLNDKYAAYTLMPEAYKRDMIRVSDASDKEAFHEFVGKHSEFCVKPSSSSCGRGIHKESLKDFANEDEMFEKLLRLADQPVVATLGENRNNVVLEELITQADVLNALHAPSVNGVRVTTLNVNGNITFFTPWLKVGNNNAFVGTAAQGGFIAGIDTDSGVVCTPGFSENGKAYPIHPFSGVKFEGIALPDWKELLAMADGLARKLPMFGYIGWDFVPTKDRGWCVMEANYAGQILGQMIYGRGMKKEFEQIISWKPDKEFWWQ